MLAKPVGGRPPRTRRDWLVGRTLVVDSLVRSFARERLERGERRVLVARAEEVSKCTLPRRFALSRGGEEVVNLVTELKERFGRREGGGRWRRWRRRNVEGLRMSE